MNALGAHAHKLALVGIKSRGKCGQKKAIPDLTTNECVGRSCPQISFSGHKVKREMRPRNAQALFANGRLERAEVKILLARLNPTLYSPACIPNATPIMKSFLLLSLVLGAYAMVAGAQTNSVTASNSADPYAHETTAQHDARMKWW